MNTRALLIVGLMWSSGCFSPPSPPEQSEDPQPSADSVGDEGDTEAPDTPGLEVLPICPGPEPCDVHCFVELPWNDNEFTALMCKEALGAAPDLAEELAAQYCQGALVTSENSAGVSLGPCPITATIPAQALSDVGWAPMQQIAGCRLEVEDGLVVHKWLYDLANSVADFTGDQGAPSDREVEAYCTDLSEDDDTSSVTLLQCVAESCEGDGCTPELCTDGDRDPCSALVCKAEATDGTLCDFDLDDTLCDDEASCSADSCTAQGCQFELDSGACTPPPCQGATCDPAHEDADEDGCILAPVEDGSVCTDDDPCTLEDACVGGACEGAAMTCTGGSADCSTQSCSGGICVAQPINSSDECSDGVGCFELFQCSGGACIGVGAQTNCDDAQQCTLDACQDGLCSNESMTESECDDGDPCTVTDRCGEDDACEGVPKVCDDGDPCMAGQCNPENGQCEFSKVPECDCCLPNEQAGCSEEQGCVCSEWAACVCTFEPSCCTAAWSTLCVNLVAACNVGGGCESMECGDGVCAELETFLTCPADCPACELDDECSDWNPCTEDVCEQTPTSIKACVNKPAPLEGTTCHDADTCIENTTCSSEGFCNGFYVKSATCDGSCVAETSEPVSFTQRARAVDMRLIGEPGDIPMGAVLFVVEEIGLRRFSYLASGSGGPPIFKDPKEVVPWQSKSTPTSVLIAGPSLAASVAFAASKEGIELLHVGAYELPPTHLDFHGSPVEPEAIALNEQSKRLIAVGQGGLEVVSVLNNIFVPVLHLSIDELSGLLGVSLSRLIDVAVRGNMVYLLDEEAGILAIDDQGAGEITLTANLSTHELFPGGEPVHPSFMQLSDQGIYVLGTAPVSTSSHRLAGVATPSTMELSWSWQLSMHGHEELLDMAAGPCGGVTFALGEEGLGWLLPPPIGSPSVASDESIEVEMVVRDMGFPVEAAAVADLCDADGIGSGWAAVAGGGGGAALTLAEADAPGVLGQFEILGAQARTGLASQIAILKGTEQTMAFVADGSGLQVDDGSKLVSKAGLRLYDVTKSLEPFLVETCPMGNGTGQVKDVISDGLGRVHALVAEGEASVLVSMDEPQNGSFCNLCPACKILLSPFQDPSLWMEPLAGVPHLGVVNTELFMHLFLIGRGESWLQIADVTRHTDTAEVWLSLSEEHFPEGIEGLSALAMHIGTEEDILYLGTVGQHPALLALNAGDLYGDYPLLPDEPITVRSTLAPSDVSYSGRPVAMTVSKAGILYAVLDDVEEVHQDASCEACVDGRLWIVDVSDPDAPSELYLSGLLPTPLSGPPSGDLGNASDLVLVQDQLFIASRQRGLLIVDVSTPAEPVLTSENPVDGQASGLALVPDGVFIAAGRTPLTVVGTNCAVD